MKLQSASALEILSCKDNSDSTTEAGLVDVSELLEEFVVECDVTANLLILENRKSESFFWHCFLECCTHEHLES